ncbi:serine/threonine protein kinase [Kitasatospora sp. NBC_01287]|uniref:serine/threonine-protein kinase n=1 Tax=Kitasatospora sp. NBC_01287 TaxID=2903573 RepID=UPI00225028E3|nr:serine/threonine-protein kinase [Kitasatospora sp. NBC_01287]MCX4746786.1 serine/threonine protein kinase [Kitasatospora sp. NBC_01287]
MPADDPRTAAPPPPTFQPLHPDDPTEVAGYKLYARLGAGGMGRVYLSYTPGGRPVALKVVRAEFAEDAEFRRRFTQEVANAQRIHGLYTAQVIDAGTTADAPWLVTAYVPGPSLQQVVREHGALPVRTVLLLLGGIAEALQAIHSVAVVHRDLKPANVLVAADGPRVIDFGIARAADATALTGTGFRIGSPAFMAPEQAQGSPVTPATDVFALGALAAYVASGVPPFGEGPETAVLYRVVHEPPELAAVPDDLRELVLRCLAKSPEDRPAPAEIIEIARNHPSVGGQLRFAEDWLPAPVATELTRRSDLPRTPPPAPAAAPVAAPPRPSAPPVPTVPTTAPAAAPDFPVTGPVAPAAPPPPVEAPTTQLRPPEPTVLLQQPVPAPVPAPAPAAAPPPPPPAKRKGVSWKTLLTVAVVMALGGALGGVLLTRNDKSNSADGSSSGRTSSQAPATSPTPAVLPPPSAPGSASPDTAGPDAATPGTPGTTGTTGSSAALAPTPVSGVSATAALGGYTPLVSKIELDIPATEYASNAYRVDLVNGKLVAPGTSLKWGLSLQNTGNGGGSQADSFGSDGDDASDFAVITDPAVTPAQCDAAIDTHPDSDLSFNHASAGRLLCIRDRTTHAIGIAAVETANAQTGEVKLSVNTWQGGA